ncbi:MAG: polyprenol monophosphomannose synthase [Anaerolineales bacterium]
MEQDLASTALVIVPTYNEAENIERLVTLILQQDAPLHVVVVDDHSPDGTGKLADRLAEQDPRVSVIHRAGKLGLGTAYTAGFRQALSQGYGYAITMDADFSHHPRYLPGLLALMSQCDLAIGSRYVPQGGTEGWPLSRRFLSWGANLFARTLLGLHAHDCTAGYRCYRREVLEHIGLDTIFSSGYSFLVEMLTRCERRGYRVAELPIIFHDREAGASKISRTEITRSVYTVFRLWAERLPWRRRPHRA